MSTKFTLNRTLQAAILTISDTRTEETDKGGHLISQLLEQASVDVVEKLICKDEISEIQTILKTWTSNNKIDVIITTGGTGIAKRDCTIEAILPSFTKEISGFGELFRFLSFTEDVGTKAMLSRAVAGVVNDKAVFVLPGSVGAIKLAMTKLILPELEHIVFELTK
ncbi:MogA/MoaB family molybdenum cofactor biosynthesis protein [Psychrobacillus sp. INOP01]|uniref:MogA/MoaB family molybdenum cofactor biosynthesis protein n=1 Tax=Psychrobacillus sp. INOP01 TaxID=2829187 RepID=UPI001BA7DC20|nr:MogA/MoaB family molybdenum cofactor biosynthesis protein [Psychrobacillus sp. INOP01]QUG41509.1 MogA/MoaB family molybdenum cofactor biosynthesis protein [Psychrobacillus sp. INOP01]